MLVYLWNAYVKMYISVCMFVFNTVFNFSGHDFFQKWFWMKSLICIKSVMLVFSTSPPYSITCISIHFLPCMPLRLTTTITTHFISVFIHFTRMLVFLFSFFHSLFNACKEKHKRMAVENKGGAKKAWLFMSVQQHLEGTTWNTWRKKMYAL